MPIMLGDGRLVLNRNYQFPPTDAGTARAVLGESGRAKVLAELEHCPKHAVTPLVDLDRLAAHLGVAAVAYKVESDRLGLDSFKALGRAYAVARVLQRKLASTIGIEPTIEELVAGRFADETRDLVVACATDGNHGRSVAAGARLFGCRSRIYLHAGVPPEREEAIAAFGAQIIRVAGNYDDSVHAAEAQSRANGAIVVADTATALDDPITLDVMQGYTVMIGEALGQFPDATHMFVQAGVGGLAAAVAAMIDDRFGATRPRLVVVEPTRADCLQASAIAGHPAISGDLHTDLEMLACGEPSVVAWAILAESAFAFITVSDGEVRAAQPMVAATAAARAGTPSAIAGLAGTVRACKSPEAMAVLGIDRGSRILLFGTEQEPPTGSGGLHAGSEAPKVA